MRRCDGGDHSKLSLRAEDCHRSAAGHQLPTLAQHFERHAIEPRCVTAYASTVCAIACDAMRCDLFKAHVLSVRRLA